MKVTVSRFFIVSRFARIRFLAYGKFCDVNALIRAYNFSFRSKQNKYKSAMW